MHAHYLQHVAFEGLGSIEASNYGDSLLNRLNINQYSPLKVSKT